MLVEEQGSCLANQHSTSTCISIYSLASYCISVSFHCVITDISLFLKINPSTILGSIHQPTKSWDYTHAYSYISHPHDGHLSSNASNIPNSYSHDLHLFTSICLFLFFSFLRKSLIVNNIMTVIVIDITICSPTLMTLLSL